MRVITGIARGKRLVTVSGNDIVRPTGEKVKEALFSSIQFDIEGRRVLDLFAGSGQLGIEALSRGADSATFVDSNDASLKAVKQNLENTGLSDKASVHKSDYATFALRCTQKFDIAFLDPPYQAGLLQDAVSKIIPLMSDYGKIFCEHPSELKLPEKIDTFSVCKVYRYGKTLITVYKKDVAEDE
ncbi:MAG: 16S rRNA (guanine(966)-N(2))-methyltransferase RsmD [Clostridia bacterium]|nr:16S rRNA (guanine(966)-N(2))-methyltransferase RsmD [Clostridia bacterium]